MIPRLQFHKLSQNALLSLTHTEREDDSLRDKLRDVLKDADK